MSGEAALQRAKEVREIQMKIRSEYPKIPWPEPVLEPIFYGRFDKTPVLSRKLMLDVNTGVQFDIVSDLYELIPHELATYNLLQAIPIEFGKPELKFKLWADGARFRLEALFPDLPQMEVQKGDPVRPKIMQTNSLDRSTFYGLEFGADQLVCSNGMVAYKMESKSQRRHILGAADLDEMTANMLESVKGFSDQVGIWNTWAQIRFESAEELDVPMSGLKLSDGDKSRILALPIIAAGQKNLITLVQEKKATLWDVNSALTQYTTHEIASDQKAFELERRVAAAFSDFAERAAA